jgi:hypothetical protein
VFETVGGLTLNLLLKKCISNSARSLRKERQRQDVAEVEDTESRLAGLTSL